MRAPTPGRTPSNFIGTNFDDTMLSTRRAGSAVDSFSGLDGVDTVDANAAPAVAWTIDLDILDPRVLTIWRT